MRALNGIIDPLEYVTQLVRELLPMFCYEQQLDEPSDNVWEYRVEQIIPLLTEDPTETTAQLAPDLWIEGAHLRAILLNDRHGVNPQIWETLSDAEKRAQIEDWNSDESINEATEGFE